MLSPEKFRSRFHEFSRTSGLFGERDTVIAAVSGGLDSMVMLDLLAGEARLRLIVAHMNHGLRGAESDGDEALVVRRARDYGAGVQVMRAETAGEAKRRGLGIQETARLLRYAFLESVRAGAGGDRIATAHHADDNAETILLHLFRGTGAQGMAGIPVLRDGICRPLLFARREEIEVYAQEAGLPFRTDSSNDRDAYTRNALRHHILPLLKEHISPGVVENINRSGEHFRDVAAYLATESARALDLCTTQRWERELRLSLPRLAALPDLLRQLVVMTAAEAIAGSRPESAQVAALIDLIGNTTGSRVTLPGGFEALRNRDEMILRAPAADRPFRIAVEPDHEYRVGNFRFAARRVEREGILLGADKSTEFVDADRIARRGLTLRTWLDGDAFVPLGMSTRKKISDFFVDEKIPLYEKHSVPILETTDGEVVWICGRRIDDRFKITDATQHVLKLEFSSTALR